MAISFTFDGQNRRIYMQHTPDDLNQNMFSFHAREIYAAWKEWCVNGDGMMYPPAFDVIGGEPISDTTNTGSYFFMRTDYGWMGVPPELDNIVINIQGNLYPKVVGDVVLEPLPTYTTTLIMQTSSLTETVTISSGSGLSETQASQLSLAASESAKGRKMQTNKAIISGDGLSVSIYDDDGTSLLHTFDVSADKKTRTPL